MNNNRGVFLQPSTKKNGQAMEACFFGAGCTRPGCIYRHDRDAIAANPQSEEPCAAYLAGFCSFNAKSCRKRHPPPAEAERLRQKYGQIRCRYGSQCQTQGCLYRHEALSEPVNLDWTTTTTQPACPIAAPAPMAVPGTSWRPTPPAGSPQPPSSFRPMPPTRPPQPPVLTRPLPPLRPPQALTMQQPSLSSAAAGRVANSPPPPQPATSPGLNTDAKEWVPGGSFR